MEKISPEQGIAETPHAQIYYQITGSGTPLLMLHGNSETHHVFSEYEKRLSTRYQIILMDSRAHGRSFLKQAYAKEEFTTADMAKDVAALLNHLHIEACLLFGFSDGANIALEFASLFPSRVLAVVAVSGNVSPDGLITPVRLFSAGKYYALKAINGLFSSHGSHHLFRHQQLASLLCHSPMLTDKQLQAITAPVLLIAGTRDVIKTSHSRKMANLIPHAQLILVHGATHTALFHHEAFYLKIILEFLQSLQ